MSALLTGRGLALLRGDRLLFAGLDLALETGELLLVQGPNGSGKTSLLRIVAGLLPPDEGEILWRGEPTRRRRQTFHAELAWLGHRAGFKGDLTLAENLRFESGLRSPGPVAGEAVRERLGLRGLDGIPFRLLSAGQQRRAALARIVVSGAKLWLLDEPLTNLDAAGRELVNELLAEHLAAGGLAMMASHQEPDVRAPVRRVSLQ